MAESKPTNTHASAQASPSTGAKGSTSTAPAPQPTASTSTTQTAPNTGVRWRYVWPIPALLLATTMLAGGVVVALMNRTKPPAEIPLEVAKALVHDGRFEEAIEKLNSKDVRSFLDYGSPTKEHRQAFHLARARAFSGAQQKLGLSRPENNKSIVEDYQQCEKLGLELEPTDISTLTSALIDLDKVDDVLARISSLPDSEQSRKTRHARELIEHNLLGPDKRPQLTLELLARMSSDPALTPADRAWVLARQAEMLVASNQYEEAISKLVRRIGLLKDVPAEQQGELYLLLGKAYFLSDQPQSALKQLEAADALLDRASLLRAELGVMMGRLAQAGQSPEGTGAEPEAALEQAKERFERVITEFGPSKSFARALLGIAEVEAMMRHDNEAIEKFAELAEVVRGGPAHGAGQAGHAKPPPGDVTIQVVSDSLMRAYSARFEAGERENALRFADLAESLYPDSQVPPEITLAIGSTRLAIAQSILAQAKAQPASTSPATAISATRPTTANPASRSPETVSSIADADADVRIEDLDPTTRAEVRQNFVAAGEYLRRHGRAVAATDPALSASSLWRAADAFDRAGDLDEARKSFSDYADGASDTDPNKPAAMFRLAQVFQAQRDYPAAAALYRQLVEARGLGDANGSAGIWADQSMVPLAKCLLADTDTANDDEAQRLLVSVVDGSTLSPEAPAYRDALIELGSMYYQTGKYPDAISWLEQAVKRYKADRRIDLMRFRLADAHRLEAIRIAKTLSAQRLPAAQVEQLESQRLAHLNSARLMYEDVRAALEKRPPRSMTGLERVYLRNAYSYLGDCAFELKDFDGAIAAYDTARLKYADDPSSLVAMAQIVSSYVAQGRWAQAKTANERAKQQLARFPDAVWQNPDLPMDKRHWERWLESRTLLEQANAKSNQTSGAQGADEPR